MLFFCFDENTCGLVQAPTIDTLKQDKAKEDSGRDGSLGSRQI